VEVCAVWAQSIATLSVTPGRPKPERLASHNTESQINVFRKICTLQMQSLDGSSLQVQTNSKVLSAELFTRGPLMPIHSFGLKFSYSCEFNTMWHWLRLTPVISGKPFCQNTPCDQPTNDINIIIISSSIRVVKLNFF